MPRSITASLLPTHLGDLHTEAAEGSLRLELISNGTSSIHTLLSYCQKTLVRPELRRHDEISVEVFWWGVTWSLTRSCLQSSRVAVSHRAFESNIDSALLFTHNKTPSVTAMEDTTMLEGSQGLFAELSFTIFPNGMSEDRISQVRDASDRLGSVTNKPYRLKTLSRTHTERLYPSTYPKAA
jgi:hypothetical protein